MLETHLRTQNQCAEAQIRQRQDDVVIAVHVAVMEQMVAVEPEENSRTFHIAFPRQMHAPMDIFVDAIIRAASESGANDESPMPDEKRYHHKRDGAQRHQSRAVPPSHRNRDFVLLIDEMIGVIGFEDAMVNERVTLERIGEFAQRAMHQKAVQDPLEHGSVNNRDERSNGGPI